MANVSTEIRIQDKSHVTNCFEELRSLWESEQLCDLTLKVAEMEFKVHKLILVSCSKYFKNMFTQELFVENDKNYVELRQVDPNTFRVILEYFYSGYIVISEDTVNRVLATADFLSLTALKSICAEYLLKNIDIKNSISRYCIGVTFGLTKLKCETKSFILDKLDEVSKTSDFQEINQDTLKELLTTTEPHGNGEQIYTAVMCWVKHDVDKRKLFLSDFLHLIPTENISHDFYMNSMKDETILRQNFKCLNWLLDNIPDKPPKLNVAESFEPKFSFAFPTSDKPLFFPLQRKSKELKTLSARPDKCTNPVAKLNIAKSLEPKFSFAPPIGDKPLCFPLQLKNNELENLSARPDKCTNPDIFAKLNVAGSLEHKFSFQFKLKSKELKTLSAGPDKSTNWLLDNIPDKFAKLNFAESLETKLFITCQCSRMSECFQFEVKSNGLKTLPYRPDIVAFSAISYKKSIYLTAGAYNRDLEKSFKYDPDENSWSEINLSFERCGAGACILHDRLFIVGGCNSRSDCILNSCISYNFNSNQKLMLPQMKKKRCRPGISTYKNSVYVCCGREGPLISGNASTLLSCIERFDPREGQWQNVGKCKFVSGPCSSAVISDFLYTSRGWGEVFERFDFRNYSSKELAKPVGEFWNWITYSQGKLLRVHGTGLSEYNINNNRWLDKEYNFNLNEPIIVPWDST